MLAGWFYSLFLISIFRGTKEQYSVYSLALSYRSLSSHYLSLHVTFGFKCVFICLYLRVFMQLETNNLCTEQQPSDAAVSSTASNVLVSYISYLAELVVWCLFKTPQ